MKAIEQYFPVILFIMLYKVVLSIESVDEILKYDHSNERYWAVLFCDTVYYAVQGGSKMKTNFYLRFQKYRPHVEFRIVFSRPHENAKTMHMRMLTCQ